jgi:DNA repair protein RecO (recombination protein O)
MLHATKGIVFHTLKYSETSIIVKIYTELFGIQSYLFRGIRSSKSKIKPGLFQSMTLLDLVVYHKENQSLQSVKEVHLAHPYKTIPFDIRKSSVMLFINELVYKAIREEEANPGLFSFLWESCMQLDETEERVSFYHIWFAVMLMHHLGIFPHDNYSTQFQVFNLREGIFQEHIPDHAQYLDQEKSRQVHDLLASCDQPIGREHSSAPVTGAMGAHAMGAHKNAPLLETLLVYYQLHLPGFKGMQSHHILHNVLA